MKKLLRAMGVGSSNAAAEVIGVRLSRISLGSGPAPSLVLTDWKNTGSVPVRLIIGDVNAYNAAGELVFQIIGATIYKVSDDKPGVAPGQTYQSGQREGVMANEGAEGAPGPITTAQVKITRVAVKSRS